MQAPAFSTPLRARAASLFVAPLLALFLTGCAYRVTPPLNPREPATVYIADYGYHASLLLPRGSATWVEYGFGEWGWFAEGNTAWYRGVPILFGARGALGMRPIDAEEDELAQQYSPSIKFQPVTVEQAAVDKLLNRLDERFGHGGEPTFNPAASMSFVPDRQRYSLAHHCNTAVAHWLRELGCQVTGDALIADFRIMRPVRAPAP